MGSEKFLDNASVDANKPRKSFRKDIGGFKPKGKKNSGNLGGNDNVKFSALSQGIEYNCKFIGSEIVKELRGKLICQQALQFLKDKLKTENAHKPKIIFKISLSGISIFDSKNKILLHKHPVNRISFVSKDSKDNKCFGYIVSLEDKNIKYFGFKAEKSAEAVVTSIHDLFMVIKELKSTNTNKVTSAHGSGQITNHSSGIYTSPSKLNPNHNGAQSPPLFPSFATNNQTPVSLKSIANSESLLTNNLTNIINNKTNLGKEKDQTNKLPFNIPSELLALSEHFAAPVPQTMLADQSMSTFTSGNIDLFDPQLFPAIPPVDSSHVVQDTFSPKPQSTLNYSGSTSLISRQRPRPRGSSIASSNEGNALKNTALFGDPSITGFTNSTSSFSPISTFKPATSNPLTSYSNSVYNTNNLSFNSGNASNPSDNYNANNNINTSFSFDNSLTRDRILESMFVEATNTNDNKNQKILPSSPSQNFNVFSTTPTNTTIGNVALSTRSTNQQFSSTNEVLFPHSLHKEHHLNGTFPSVFDPTPDHQLNTSFDVPPPDIPPPPLPTDLMSAPAFGPDSTGLPPPLPPRPSYSVLKLPPKNEISQSASAWFDFSNLSSKPINNIDTNDNCNTFNTVLKRDSLSGSGNANANSFDDFQNDSFFTSQRYTMQQQNAKIIDGDATDTRNIYGSFSSLGSYDEALAPTIVNEAAHDFDNNQQDELNGPITVQAKDNPSLGGQAGDTANEYLAQRLKHLNLISSTSNTPHYPEKSQLSPGMSRLDGNIGKEVMNLASHKSSRSSLSSSIPSSVDFNE